MFAISNDTNRFLTDSFNNRRKSTASRKAVSMPIEMATSGTPIRRDSPTAVLPKRPNGSPTPKIGAIGSQVLKIDDAKLTTLSIVVASFASSIFSTWLPIAPILGVGLPLGLLGRTAVGESLLIGVPLVAISMGIETAFLDAVLFRLLLKESVKKRFVSLLIANILNASIALALGLAWAFRHLPIFVANADSWR